MKKVIKYTNPYQGARKAEFANAPLIDLYHNGFLVRVVTIADRLTLKEAKSILNVCYIKLNASQALDFDIEDFDDSFEVDGITYTIIDHEDE